MTPGPRITRITRITRIMSKAKTSPTIPASEEATFITAALTAEADAVRRVAARVATEDAAAWTSALDLLEACTGHVVVSGMGKSGLVGAKISATFSSLGQPSSVLHPAEAVHGDLGRVRRGDVVVLLSFSGETEEVVDLALILRTDGVPCLGISNHAGSSLAQRSTVHLCLGDITEACPLNLAPTASTTAQLAVGDALALALARRRDFGETDFKKAHPGGLLGVGLRNITDAIRFRADDTLPVLPDTLPVRAALERARVTAGGHRRAGAIMLVDDGGRLSGIFTDGDLRRLVLDAPDGLDRPIAAVMTARPKHLTVHDLVRDAERLVREHRVDEIPVVDEAGRPIGLVDVQDLIAMKVVKE
ncbi:MAG: KpsF/GutQ family sugar-phosphate isomerase [Phycisphaerales bacterium]|nr:KpsF/GutQ family sugar-phosphate isomerase [Phycisphaerales bacterium]